MQYQVPQFIETEDKVVGPFSIRQFIYVGIAVMVSGVCYFLVQTWLFFIVALVLIGGSLALSFVKVNGRPLIHVALSAFNFYWKPQTYVWKAEHPVAAQQPKPRATTAGMARELPHIVAKKVTHMTHATPTAVVHSALMKPAAPVTKKSEPGVEAEPIQQSQPVAEYINPPAEPAPVAMATEMAAKPVSVATPAAAVSTEKAAPKESIALGAGLHKIWQSLQTGTPPADAPHKSSDRQFIEKKMAERYEIFRRQSGDKAAARRVDYR